MTANKKTQLFEPRHLSKTTFPLQTSYGNPLSFRVYRTSPLSVITDLRVCIRSNHSFLNLSRYCRNFIRPDTMFMRVPLFCHPNSHVRHCDPPMLLFCHQRQITFLHHAASSTPMQQERKDLLSIPLAFHVLQGQCGV
jgi:hypothetical protein